jgi:putative ABC transport system substrate-binding protein
MMDRRAFLTTIGAVVAAAPLVGEAQQAGRIYRIGVLWPAESPPRSPRMEALRQGMQELGYIEGQTVTIEVRYAAGGVERLPKLAGELVHSNVDVMVTVGILATIAAQQTTAVVPIVALADELVRPGLVASLPKPGGNTTGVQILAPEVTAKRLELLKQIVPTLSRVAALTDPGQSASQLPPLEEAARSLGVQLQVLGVRGEKDIEGAFESVKAGRAGAIHILASPLLFAYTKTIIGLAAKHRLPAIYEWREAVDAGGLVSYGPVLFEMWRQTGIMAGKVLKGAKPADLPIEQPTKFELVINLRTAKALGLTIPQSLLVRADHVIQ